MVKAIRGISSNSPGNWPRRFPKRLEKLAESILEDDNIEDAFDQAIICSATNNADGTAYTGAAAEVIGFNSGKACYEAYVAAVATGAAILYPFQSADGLELPSLVASTGPESWELTNGISSRSKAAHVVGAFRKPFYAEAVIKIDDISDLTELFFGFRKAEAYQVDPDDYDEMASFNVGKDADGQIEIHTILNGGATAEVDTTLADWVDGESHTLRVEVDQLGNCSFSFDGAAPTVTAVFAFDSGEVVVPFLHINTETGDPGVSISSWVVGYK